MRLDYALTLAIYRPAMPNPHDKYNEAFVLDLADHLVVAHPVAPKLSKRPTQSIA